MVTISQRVDGRWVKPCPDCGETQDYLRKNYAEESLRLNKVCKKCSNRKTENNHRGMYNLIRISWFNKSKVGVETRGLKFDLTLEDIWFLYTLQEGRCALSDIPIGWSEVGSIHTASIDRIDSSKGYLKDNVQLLHKDVNFMKQQYSQEYFIEICRSIADKVKW